MTEHTTPNTKETVVMTEHTTPNTIAEMVACLDALADATRAGDVTAYRNALTVANERGASDEQILDAYRWGRRQGTAALDFNHHGQAHRR